MEAPLKVLLALPKALPIAPVPLLDSEDEMPAMAVELNASAETILETRLETRAAMVDDGCTETKVTATATDVEVKGTSAVKDADEAGVVAIITGVVLKTAGAVVGSGGAEDAKTGGGRADATDVDAAPATFTAMATPASAGFKLLAV